MRIQKNGLLRYGWATGLVAILSFLVLYPILMLLYGSISTGSPVSDSFGHQFSIKAFWDVLADPNVFRAFHNTLVECFGGTVLVVCYGLFFSWVTARPNPPLRRNIKTITIMYLVETYIINGVSGRQRG